MTEVILRWTPELKCRICNESFIPDEQHIYYANKFGSIGIAHSICYDKKYGEK